MADGGFCKCVVAVQVLVKDKAVHVEVRKDSHHTSAQNDWSAERLVVGGGVGSEVVGHGVG